MFCFRTLVDIFGQGGVYPLMSAELYRQLSRFEKSLKLLKTIDFSHKITILFSYEAMTQGAQNGRLQSYLAGHLESKERNRS
jgi:hypothetical protein